MSEPASFRDGFASAWVFGLLWGIVAAIVIAIVATGVAVASFGLLYRGPVLFLETVVWTALAATALAVFPIGPVGAVLGWLLYRRRVVSRVAYTAAGAVASVTAPVLFLVLSVESLRYPTTNLAVISDPAVPLILSAFAMAGAFGGFMAGRIIRRRALNR